MKLGSNKEIIACAQVLYKYKCFKKITDEKLNEACFQPNHLWTGCKAIRELHKITFNEQHQFDLLYLSHNMFEGNTYGYIVQRPDLHQDARLLKPLGARK